MTDKEKPTIVVVDDSATSLSLYQFSVKSLAVDFVGFKSPAEAIPYLQEHTPDLLFLDIIMPGMDGLSLLKHIRTFSHQQNTRVIMVTSKDYDQDRLIAKQLGAIDFLIKPLRFKEIRDIVCQYLDVDPNPSS